MLGSGQGKSLDGGQGTTTRAQGGNSVPATTEPGHGPGTQLGGAGQAQGCVPP